MGEAGDQPSDTMRERAGESTLKVWLLLDADRRLVAALLSGLLFVLVVGAAGNATLLVALTTTVALTPFTILLAYVLRIVTVTKRTLSIGPFILRDTDRTVGFDED